MNLPCLSNKKRKTRSSFYLIGRWFIIYEWVFVGWKRSQVVAPWPAIRSIDREEKLLLFAREANKKGRNFINLNKTMKSELKGTRRFYDSDTEPAKWRINENWCFRVSLFAKNDWIVCVLFFVLSLPEWHSLLRAICFACFLYILFLLIITV